jgi:hypothetical protein
MAKAEKPKSKKKPDKEQTERFKEAARKIGADESGGMFEGAFGKIVPPKRPPEKAKGPAGAGP